MTMMNGLGKRENDQGFCSRRCIVQCSVPTSHDRHVLLPTLACISDRDSVRARVQFCRPNSLPVFESNARKRRSFVAPINTNPPAVAIGPPRFIRPVFLLARGNSSVIPSGTCQAKSPVCASTADQLAPRWFLARPRMFAGVGNIADARIALAPLEARHRPHDAIAVKQHRRPRPASFRSIQCWLRCSSSRRNIPSRHRPRRRPN